ncbi:MAG: diguanylate cyclase [Burkholderiaceae bacterium]
MTLKAISISVGARTLLALFVLGMLLVALSSGWQLRAESLRRGALQDRELSAIPLLYAGPLAYSVERQPDAVRGLLHHILTRHGLSSVELRTQGGQQYRAQSDDGTEPGTRAEFPLGSTGDLSLQAPAISLSNTLKRDPLLRTTLLHLALMTALGIAVALMLDRWLLRQLRRMSDEANRFDATRPPPSLSWLEPDQPRPRELLQLEQAFAHVRSSFTDELAREQSAGLALRQEIARQHRALQQAERSLEAKQRELASLARVDALTGLPNRREFEVALRREFKRAQRDQGRLALAILDLDHLKPFNDQRGREAGDDLLKRLAALLAERFERDTDLVARLGGEEFVVLLPGFEVEAAQGLMESLRDAWRLHVQAGTAGTGGVTVSVGLAAYQPERPYLSAQSLMQAADEALYLAKHMGRDRLCIAS